MMQRLIQLVTVGALAFGVTFSVGATAEAQEDPYATAGGSPARARGQVPEGMWVAGGFHSKAHRGHGTGGLRAEVGLPLLEMSEDMRLALALPLYTGHARWYNEVFLVPEVQLEIDLPINMRHKLAVVPFAGLGLGFHFWRDRWLGVTERSTDVSLVIPMGAWARFTLDSGWMFQVMPLGMALDIYMTHGGGFFASYRFFAMAGYRFD
jgi:hypothetical protein